MSEVSSSISSLRPDSLTVPVERVRLDTDVVTEQETVTESVRKEEIELDTSDTPRTTGL